jgi:methionyl-tRNA synthetase
MISFQDFSRLDLRVGKILEVAEHPKADKLYVLKVDIGDRVIQLVAGIKNCYSPLDLEGRLIVVLANLEPKVLRGIESQGMLLAAQSQEKIVLISPEKEIEPGSIIR